MQTIKPASEFLLCQPDEEQKVTASGILLSEKASEKPKTAKVINIGDSVTRFHSGDRIVYKSYSTSDIKLNNDDFFLVEERDVLGTVLEVEDA